MSKNKHTNGCCVPRVDFGEHATDLPMYNIASAYTCCSTALCLVTSVPWSSTPEVVVIGQLRLNSILALVTMTRNQGEQTIPIEQRILALAILYI